jgi:tRNA nucleotidyltransferase (CCA-adding enzyme)
MFTEEIIQMGKKARSRGWHVLLVGGAVRDRIRGESEFKDLDFEFYGPSSEELEEFLEELGTVKKCGKSFGVYKLRLGESDLDISLPRRESKTGKGHKGFTVECDEGLTPREAALRRDFTMNSVAMDIETGEVIDPFGGTFDIGHGILRHTSEQFVEDPLRVLRGFQFCGRFDMEPTKETIELCRQLRPEYTELSRERVWVEWEKWCERSTVPSKGLKFLLKTGCV